MMTLMDPFQVRIFHDSLKSKDTGFINTTQVFKQSKAQKTWVQILSPTRVVKHVYHLIPGFFMIHKGI